MLIILMLFLIIASIVVLIIKRNRETFFLFGICVSLAVMLSGILIYISKKGGISGDLQNFFFVNMAIKVKVQYLLITLDQLGMVIAIGRYLFPFFILLLALHYSMIPWLKNNKWVKIVSYIAPAVSLIIYYPDIFRYLTDGRPEVHMFITNGVKTWIILYVVIAIFLFVYEFFAIQLKVLKKRHFFITSFILSLCFLYLLYFGQDPAQVYQFYSGIMWNNGIYYMNSLLSIRAYIVIVLLNVIFAIIGFTGFMRYTVDVLASSREEITIQRKIKAISPGVSMFVHGIKNKLLANEVLIKRINRIHEGDVKDPEKEKEYLTLLSKQNDDMLKQMNSLYRSIKTNIIRLSPTSLREVIEDSLDSFRGKYSDSSIKVVFPKDIVVLADKTYLSEAVYNLLINAQEAVSELENPEEGEVILTCYNVRVYTVIEVKDNGVGMTKSELKKAFEPFYSKKNSNFNWGMGLQYVRIIAKEHFGTLRYQSKKGDGSTFYLLLTKFIE